MVDNYPFPHARILFFAKTPKPGETKTRLIPTLGEAGAARLHALLLQQVIGAIAEANLAPVDLWCLPDCEHPLFQRLSRTQGVNLHRQMGDDLGDRMAHALESALAGASYALLCGTDCPVLTPEVIGMALKGLDEGSDAVLVPAEDGGYVAVGLRQPAPWLFHDMQWSVANVAEITRERSRARGWRWSEPTALWDVDEADDLRRLEQTHPQLWQEVSRFFSSEGLAPDGE